jgi:hypothetical protein
MKETKNMSSCSGPNGEAEAVKCRLPPAEPPGNPDDPTEVGLYIALGSEAIALANYPMRRRLLRLRRELDARVAGGPVFPDKEKKP